MGKKLSILLAVFAVCIGLGSPASAATIQGYVTKSGSRHIAYEYTQGSVGMPTLLAFNGLIFELEEFHKFTDAAVAKGYSVITFAYSVQPESMKTLGANPPFFMDVTKRPSLTELADEGQAVLDQLNIQTPIVLVGLSYGTGTALTLARRTPQKFSQVILVSPLAVPTDAFAEQEKYVQMWEDMMNQTPVFGPIWVNQTQENITEYYASYLVSDPKNKFASGVLPAYIQQGIVAQIRAAEDFLILNVKFSPLPRVDFIVSGKDIPLRLHNQLDGYRGMLSQGHDGSFTVLRNTPHVSPEAAPIDVANAVDFYIQNKAQPGAVYTVNPADHSRALLTEEQKQQLYQMIDKVVH